MSRRKPKWYVPTDKFFEKGFNENHGIWLTLAGINPAGPQWMVFTFFTIMICVSMLSVTAYHVMDKDVGLCLENLHFVVFIIVHESFYLSFKLQKETVRQIYRHIGEGFYAYGKAMDDKTREEARKIIESSRNRRKLLIPPITVLAVIAYASMNILRPFIKYLMGEHLIDPPEEGMYRLLPVAFWVPVRVSWYSYSFLFVLIEVSSMSALGLVLGHNVFFLTCCEEISSQCEIIGLTIRRAKRRAANLKIPRQDALKFCLAHSIRHHQEIIRVTKKIEKIVYYPSLFYIVGSGMLLCVSGFLFTSDKIEISTRVTFSSYLLAELGGIFVYCYYGETVKLKSSEIHDQVYSGEWIEDIALMKNYNCIVQERTLEGLEISAGGFLCLNLETYTNVMSSAFSYFNILNAMNT